MGGQTGQKWQGKLIRGPAPRPSRAGKPLLLLAGAALALVVGWQAIKPSKPALVPIEKAQVKTDDDRPSCTAFAEEKAKMLIPGPQSRIQYFGQGNRDGECRPGTTGFVSAGFAAKLNYKW